MEQNKTYIIMLVITLVAAGLLASGLYLFSPEKDDALLADAENQTFDPYVFITPQQEGEDGSSEFSDNETDEDSEATEDAESSEEDKTLIFTQRQVYGQNEQDRDESQQEDQTESTEQPSSSPSSEDDPEVAGEPAVNTGADPVDARSQTESSAARVSSRTQESSAVQASRSEDNDGTSAGSVSAGTEDEEKTIKEYWIQVFASPSMQSIEDAKAELLKHGFGGKITTTNRDDTLYYRLRYGPFEVEQEAQKFLGWITNMNQFQDAYISLEYNRR